MAHRKKKHPAVPLRQILQEVFKGKPVAIRLREGKIWEVWETAVGRQIAQRAHPLRIHDGVLTVMVNSGPWMQQLALLKGELIRKLNDLTGDTLVRDIFLKAGKLPHAAPPPVAPELPHPISAADETFIAAETKAISDPEIRSAVRLAMKSYFSRPR